MKERFKKQSFPISLQNRLALTYALFTGLALAALTIIINIFTGVIFTSLVKTNITEKSAEIVRAIGDQYDPLNRDFDISSIGAMGMYFIHEGYIISVEDEQGGPVWDARTHDMLECMTVLNTIAGRMEGHFGMAGDLRREQYPLQFAGKTTGTVIIETYGPFFYSETESGFLRSINRVLIAATVYAHLYKYCDFHYSVPRHCPAC
jgi:hypothetical protein